VVELPDTFGTQTSVEVWYASLQRQTRLVPQEWQAALRILAAFCAYVGQAPDVMIAACRRDTRDGTTIQRRSRQHYAAQIEAFQRQTPGDLRQQVQYGRMVRSFFIHNGIMLQAGWQYKPRAEQV
jgi:hypothetical protein